MAGIKKKAHAKVSTKKPITKTRKRAKLTAAKVAQLRKAAKGGKVTQAQLARKFGVSKATVSAVARGATWKNVSGAHAS